MQSSSKTSGLIFFLFAKNKTSDDKLVTTLTDSATLTGFAAGVGWIVKKFIKEPMTSLPSSNLMNNVKFTVVIAASIAKERNLEKPGREFMGEVTKEIAKHVRIRRGNVNTHGTVERFNRTLAERLFTFQ